MISLVAGQIVLPMPAVHTRPRLGPARVIGLLRAGEITAGGPAPAGFESGEEKPEPAAGDELTARDGTRSAGLAPETSRALEEAADSGEVLDKNSDDGRAAEWLVADREAASAGVLRSG